MQIKAIHISDLHVGYLTGFTGEAGTLRRRDLLAALQNICESAKEEGADFLLISGDLAESPLRPEDREKIKNCFIRLSPVKVIWIRGAADWDVEKQDWPENVYVVEPGFHKLEFPDKQTVIWGESWHQASWNDGFCEFIPPAPPQTVQILMVYGEADDRSAGRHPIDMEALRNMDVDYCALGGRHRMTLWGREGHVWAAYPGSPEPLDFSEEGDHGYLVITLEKGENYRIQKAERRITARRRAVRRIIRIEPEMDEEDLADSIREAFSEENRRRDLCAAVLRGCRKGFVKLDTIQIQKRLSDFVFIEVEDETDPELDLDYLRDANENNLLGRYIAAMQERIRHAADDKERQTLEAALAAGAQALMDSSGKGR